MNCLSCSSSKSFNKLILPKTKTPSHTHSFLKLKLNDIELNSKKKDNRFYYKNPQFLNNSNIQKQINILLTSASNKKANNKLPKLILEEINKSQNIKKEYLDINTNKGKIDDDPLKLKIPRINSLNNNNDNSNKNLNKSVDYTYKSIFHNYPLFKEKIDFIDNKLNLLYCQNESQYKFIMEKRKKIKGMSMIIEEDFKKTKEKVNNIKTKVTFMKNVIDYSYPNFLLAKIKIWKRNLAEIKARERSLPQKEQKNQVKNKNIFMANYLKKNVKVYPLKSE